MNTTSFTFVHRFEGVTEKYANMCRMYRVRVRVYGHIRRTIKVHFIRFFKEGVVRTLGWCLFLRHILHDQTCPSRIQHNRGSCCG